MERHKVSEVTYITYLIHRHREGSLTASEQQDLMEWINRKDENKQLWEELMDPEQQIKAIVEISRYSRKQETLEKIYKMPKAMPSSQQLMPDAFRDSDLRDNNQNNRISSNWLHLKKWSNSIVFKSAAVITLMLSIGIYFYQQQQTQRKNKAQLVYDAAPGGNRAILTLADGRRINLNESKEAVVITANQLSYNDGTKILEAPVTNHTNEGAEKLNNISTPKGGQYQIILSDGTKVYLNAASSLKYPEQFKGNKRVVELIGEAYFEVSHQPSKPFLVKSGQQTIRVLGTQFNVNAYPEESKLKTTLLKGSVMVSINDTRNSKILIPGQQSVIERNSIQVRNADVEEATAWKNGYFKFNEEPLESIMRKLSRWYNVEVSFRDRISPDQVFSGRVSRFEAVSSVLEALELTGGVHFKVEERRIIVMK